MKFQSDALQSTFCRPSEKSSGLQVGRRESAGQAFEFRAWASGSAQARFRGNLRWKEGVRNLLEQLVFSNFRLDFGCVCSAPFPPAEAARLWVWGQGFEDINSIRKQYLDYVLFWDLFPYNQLARGHAVVINRKP